MSRTRKFLGGIGFGYANQILVMAVGLWLTPFLLHRIGQHDFGLWLVGTQLLGYLTLMDFGVVALLPRATAYATGKAGGISGALDLPQLVGQTAKLILWQLPPVIIAATAIWLAIPSEWQALSTPLGLVLAAFVIAFPLRIFAAVLQGLQDLAFLGKVTMVGWFVSTLLTIALVVFGFGLNSLAIGWVVSQLLTALFCFIRLRIRFAAVLPVRLPSLPWKEARTKLTAGFWVSVAQVAQVLVNGTDVLILGKVLGPLAVVPYVCTGKLAGVLSNQPQLLMQAAEPALSELKMAESAERIFKVCSALSQAMLILSGAVVCVVLAVNEGFVHWWVGPNQYGGILLSVLVLIGMALRHWNTTAAYAIFCFGFERRLSFTTLLDGLVTVISAIIFVRFLGPIGAPMGSIAGVVFVSLPANMSRLSTETNVSGFALLKALWPWFWRCLLVASAAAFAAARFAPNGFWSIAIESMTVMSIYLAVMSPLFFREPLGGYVRPRWNSMIGRINTSLRFRNADA